MTDQTDQTPEEKTSEAPAQLREALDRQKQRADTAEAAVQKVALNAIGSNAAQAKALTLSYEGDWTDLDALKGFATTELGFNLGAQHAEVEVETTVTEPSPAARAVGESQDRATAVMTETSSKQVTATPYTEDIAKALESGDVSAEIRARINESIFKGGMTL